MKKSPDGIDIGEAHLARDVSRSKQYFIIENEFSRRADRNIVLIILISIAADDVSGGSRMVQAHRLDCEAAAADCRFIVQSESETEAVELAKSHMRDVHGKNYTDDELRSEHLKIV